MNYSQLRKQIQEIINEELCDYCYLGDECDTTARVFNLIKPHLKRFSAHEKIEKSINNELKVMLKKYEKQIKTSRSNKS